MPDYTLFAAPNTYALPVHAVLEEVGAEYALALWLAERFPEAGLLVPPGHRDRGPFLQWIHYLATTMQPDVILLYHPEFYMETEAERARLRAAAMRRLLGVYAVLDRALAATPGPWFFAEGPSVPDVLLAMQTFWDEIFPDGIGAFPALERQRAAYLARPAAQRVLAAHAAESARRAKAG